MQDEPKQLPALPKHYNPIKAMSPDDRASLMAAVLDHYEAGTSIYALADQLGVDNATLYRNLVKHNPEEWKEVRAARYHSQIEQAEKDMKEASDQLAVTRAREQLANARWMLERLQRSIYGQDSGEKVGNAVQININLRSGSATSHVDAEQHQPIIERTNLDNKLRD